MKKRVITILLVSGILLTGCNKEEGSSIIETQEPLIYVDRDDLLYSNDGSTTEQTTEDSNSTEDTSSEETSSATKPADEGGGSGGVTPTTTKPSGGNTTTPKVSETEEPDDEVYNTTVEQNMEELDVSFGKITITFFTEIADTEKENANGIIRTGISRDFELGDNSYGFYRDNLLATNGATFIDDPFKVSIPETDECPYAFDFVGAGHYLKKADIERGTNFWFELERNGSVLTHTAISKITAAGGYSVAVKGIAVKLDDFDAIKSNGYANATPQVALTFYVTVGGTEQTIDVGMPYQSLVDLLGEGTAITGELVIDEETGETEEVTYYVYKTADYTLLVEKQEYPEIKPKKEFVEEDGVSEDTVLVKTIFLIKNDAELPPPPDEE